MSLKSGSASLGYTERAASALKSGTAAAAAAGFTVGSTIAYVAPHYAGAIDVIVVQQPDNSYKSSPFYVRFGKYSHLRTQNKDVQISVNDIKMDFVMHLGRSGEAYFLEEKAKEDELATRDGNANPPHCDSIEECAGRLCYSVVGEPKVKQPAMADNRNESREGPCAGRTEDEYLAGAMSPLSGYSSGEDASFERFSRSESGASTDFSAVGSRLQHLKRQFRSADGASVDAGTWQSRLDIAGSSIPDPAPTAGDPLRTAASAPSLAHESEVPIDPSSMGRGFSQPIPLLKPRLAPGPGGASPRASDSAAMSNVKPAAEGSRHSVGEGQRPQSPAVSEIGQAFKGFGCNADATGEPEAGRSRGMSAVASLADGLAEADKLHIRIPRPGLQSGVAEDSACSPGSGSRDFQPSQTQSLPSIGDNWLESVQAKRSPELTSHVLDLPLSEIEADNADQTAEEAELGGLSNGRAGPLIEAQGSEYDLESRRPSATAESDEDDLHMDRTNFMRVSSADSLADTESGSFSFSSQGLSPRSPPQSPRGFQHTSSRPPTHPWSAAKPRLLPTPLSTQPMPATISASDAAAPVNAPRVDSKTTAFRPEPPQEDEGMAMFGNRMELEMEDEKVVDEKEAAPYALHEAHVNRKKWELDNHIPAGVSPINAAIAQREDARADQDKLQSSAPPNSAHPSEEGHATSAEFPHSAREATATKETGLEAPSASRDGFEKEKMDSALLDHRQQEHFPRGPEDTPQSSMTAGPSTNVQGCETSAPLGQSPPDHGYLEDSERSSSKGGLIPPAGLPGQAKAESEQTWDPLKGFALSLCGNKLSRETSPEEAAQIFEAHLITSKDFAASAPQMLSSSDLVCRIGGFLYPWRTAAPLVLGALAFGGSWESLLPEGSAGIKVALPPGISPPQEMADVQKAPRLADLTVAQRSSWRLWLGSWRTSSTISSSSLGDAGTELKGEKCPVQTRLQSSLTVPRSSSLTDLLNFSEPKATKRRAFVPTQDQLASLPLHLGQNTIDFTFGKTRLRAYIYLFRWSSRLIISDVDGTITRSDILGHVLPRVGLDWSHFGINRLFTNIRANGYEIMFLSSRAIAQASATRDYLHTLNQEGETLPPGPVIISPDGLFPSLYRELVLRRPHEFKIRALEDIRALFPSHWNPFYAGFGNRDTDEISYLTVGIPASKIFIINPKGELRKASSSVDTSTWSTLKGINDLVHQVFPPVNPNGSGEVQEREEFNDYNFWHRKPAIIVESDDEIFEDGVDGDYHDLSDEEYASADEFMNEAD